MKNPFIWLADLIVYNVAGLDSDSRWGLAIHFFVEDAAKIFVLAAVMIFIIGVARAGMDSERVRDFLSGRRRLAGYVLASSFGAVTPFCSCSSVPLFLGFTSARIPLGITMAFLITSPMINEVAIVLMGGLLGWRFLILYIAIGMSAGILGGAFLDRIGAERYLMPLGQTLLKRSDTGRESAGEFSGESSPAANRDEDGEVPRKTAERQISVRPRITFHGRLIFALNETATILKRIWPWVFVGVGLGAAIHGFVPETFLTEKLGAGQWWSVPAAVVLGIPLYGGAAASVPVVGSLIAKGLPVGTATVFMMSVVAVSFPEFVLLKQVMRVRLLLIFFGMLALFFTLAGWILNAVL